MKLSRTPLGSRRRIQGRPHRSRPADTSHSQRWGRVAVWTLGRCSWHHRDQSGAERDRNTYWATLCIYLKIVMLSTRFWITPTTFGMNGGLTFLARRSSQLIDAKKGCSCSSTCIHVKIRPSVLRCVHVHHSIFYVCTYKVIAAS